MFPVTVTQTNEDFKVAELNYFNGPVEIVKGTVNRYTNEFDLEFLSFAEQLKSSDKLYNISLSFDLTRGFPKLFNLDYTENSDDSAQRKFSDKALLVIVDGTVNISDIPNLVFNESLLASRRKLEKITFFFMKVITDDKIDGWFKLQSKELVKIKFAEDGSFEFSV